MTVTRALKGALSAFAQGLPYLLPIALAIYLPTNILVSLAVADLDPESMEALTQEWRLSGLAETFLGSFATVFAVLIAARTQMGKPLEFGRLFSESLARWPAMIGASFLWNIGTTLGLLLLVLPGVYLLLSWAFIAPVIVLERTKVAQAFGRSSELTKFRRFKLLITFVVLFTAIIGLGIAGYIGVELLPVDLWEQVWWPAEIALDTLLSILFLLWPMVATIYYMDARGEELEEGADDYRYPDAENGYEVTTDKDNPFRAPSY